MGAQQTTRIRQRGATLVVGMTLLLVMTLMALSAVQSTALQEQMAGNMKDRNLAFESAETAVRAAEHWLAAQTRVPSAAAYSAWHAKTTDLVFDSRGDKDSVKQDLQTLQGLTTWETRSRPFTDYLQALQGTHYNSASAQLPFLARQPRVTVELLAFKKDTVDVGFGATEETGQETYRQLVHSSGGSGNAEMMLETRYAIRFN